MGGVNDNEDTVVGLPPLGDGPPDDAPSRGGSTVAGGPTVQAGSIGASRGEGPAVAGSAVGGSAAGGSSVAGVPHTADLDETVPAGSGGTGGSAPGEPPDWNTGTNPMVSSHLGDGDPNRGRTVATPAVSPGSVIAGRYRLEELLAVTDGAATWRGVDEVLSRPVALHLLRLADPRAEALEIAARAAASVADPHFLRILDVSSDDEHAYIVREWVSGRNLAQALLNGPFDPDDATYVVRELTAAMTIAHRAGLSHLRLEPDTVVLADSGQVKVVDLAVDRVLRGTSSDDAARTDAQGIGRVLYALLTARWPDGPTLGLPAAPTQDGRLCSPRQVLAGVPGPLDEVADRILGDPPRSNRGPLHSPADIEEALDYVAGRPTRRRPLSLPPPAPPLRPETSDELESTATWRRPDQPPQPVPAPERRRPASKILGGIVAVVLLGAAGLLGYQLVQQVTGDADDTASDDTAVTPTGTPTPTDLAIAAAAAYDPLGDGAEHDEEAPLAIDGDPATLWTTEGYTSAIESLKPGVGITFDLGAVQDVSAVDLTLLSAGGTVELRAALEAAAEAPAALDDFALVATQADPPETTVTLQPDAPVRTRYLLVWFPMLPEVEAGQWRNGVAEAVVLGD